MPHDVIGEPLAVGDRVTIPCVVKSVQAGEEYCNLTVESEHGRKPDGSRETITLNAATVIKTLLLLLLITLPAFPQDAGRPGEVDWSEVARWGDRATLSGTGPRDGAEVLFSQAMAPPEDDSQQWYVTVWGHSKDPATAAIVKGFESDANLSPFVAAPPAQVAGQAWAHFNVYYADDPTQAFRFKDFAIPLAGPFPILTIQPPRDGSFGGLVGDKAADGTKITRAVVVDRLDAKAIGQPPDLRRRITASVALWCRKLQESGFQPPAKLAQRVSGPRTDAGQKRAMGGSHGQGPAGFPWGPQTPPAQPQVNPQWPAGGPATDPPVTPAPGLPDSKLLTLLFYLLTGHGSFMDYLLLGAAVVTVVLQLRKARVAKGETPIIGDKLAQILESLADILKGFNAPKETPKT